MSDTQNTGAGGTPPGGQGRPTGRSWMRIALILSVALNLLIAGAVGAHFWRLGPERGGYVSDGRSLVRNLPRERREMILEVFRERREAMNERRAAIRDARRRTGEALRSGDEAEIRGAFDDLAEAEAAATRANRDTLADIGTRLSSEEREAFARHMERRVRGDRGRRGRDNDRRGRDRGDRD